MEVDEEGSLFLIINELLFVQKQKAAPCSA
jgi:hypothetical protein